MATYAKPLAANFGSTKSGLAASVGYTVRDANRNILISKTMGTLAEDTDDAGNATTGSYSGLDTNFDDTWSGTIKYTIAGFPGVAYTEDFSPPAAAAVWAATGRTLTAFGFAVTATVPGGVKLTEDGVDDIEIEPGVNLRQALSGIGAATAGHSEVDNGTYTYFAMGNPGVIRFRSSVGAKGRNSVDLSLPE